MCCAHLRWGYYVIVLNSCDDHKSRCKGMTTSNFTLIEFSQWTWNAVSMGASRSRDTDFSAGCGLSATLAFYCHELMWLNGKLLRCVNNADEWARSHGNELMFVCRSKWHKKWETITPEFDFPTQHQRCDRSRLASSSTMTCTNVNLILHNSDWQYATALQYMCIYN